MNYLTFGSEERNRYKICILVNDIRKDEILREYIIPFDLNPEEIIVISLFQNKAKKKTPCIEQKAYIQNELVPVLNDLGIEYLLVGDGDYFKTITKSPKVDTVLGYVLDTDYGSYKTVYIPNYRTIFYDPTKVREKIALGIGALQAWIQGTYVAPGVAIIKSGSYPRNLEEIASWLHQLHSCPALTCDIETFSLKHYSAGIGTIGFAWNQGEGVCFPVDLLDEPSDRAKARRLLKEFFETYQGKIIYHHIAFDVTVLIYQLFMEHLLDNKGLLYGLEVMLRNWDDTKLISYLATNSCAGNKLSLKDQAQSFAGNYAQSDIKDIRKIPLPQLLQYNLVDCLSTWFVHTKHWGRLIDDNQLEIYESIFKPATKDIIQMQLTGMPVDMNRVREVKALLQTDYDNALKIMQDNPIIQKFTYELNEQWVIDKNETYKKKRVTLADANESFNPNSGIQLQKLLFEDLALPILAKTENKQPATGGDVLKDLRNHTQNENILSFLTALIDYKAVDKILTSFIPAMEEAQQGEDGWHYLFGNFNLGGTVSGRLSSSDPNLQNLPSNSRYAKLIKSCFRAAPGWFFCGIDFSSLEDRISALTTKDPNKIKVYTDQYDGHCLRAYAYFSDKMPDIDPNNVDSINSIAKKYPSLRQDSKVPTFALTYAGTWIAIMAQAGLSEPLAKKIEKEFHTLYRVSDEWVADKINRACIDGYVTVAFGLRVRTPLLKQVIRGTSKTPYEAEAEGRTAGNALGQSWCLLNSRAGSEFLKKVRNSDFRHDIKPCSQIHDAQYYLVRDNIDVIKYANDHVVKACQWQNHPDIWHDEVKITGEFGIFYPNWSKEVTLPNNANENEILNIFNKHLTQLKENL